MALNDVRLDGPAPVDAILSAYTIAAFDDCGGHINARAGYHDHAMTDGLEKRPAATDDAEHGTQIGIAMDGHAILPNLLPNGPAPAGLDRCNGHATGGGTYRQHQCRRLERDPGVLDGRGRLHSRKSRHLLRRYRPRTSTLTTTNHPTTIKPTGDDQ